MVPGVSTCPRLLGDWLAGVILDDDPNTDRKNHIGGPSVSRDELILIDPLSSGSFRVPLGRWCELLSIEDNIVYYRLEKELYKARIQDHAIVDRQLIARDMQVFGINWAFRGRVIQ